MQKHQIRRRQCQDEHSDLSFCVHDLCGVQVVQIQTNMTCLSLLNSHEEVCRGRVTTGDVSGKRENNLLCSSGACVQADPAVDMHAFPSLHQPRRQGQLQIGGAVGSGDC